jgi:hypothetical protein
MQILSEIAGVKSRCRSYPQTRFTRLAPNLDEPKCRLSPLQRSRTTTLSSR